MKVQVVGVLFVLENGILELPGHKAMPAHASANRTVGRFYDPVMAAGRTRPCLRFQLSNPLINHQGFYSVAYRNFPVLLPNTELSRVAQFMSTIFEPDID